MCVWREIRTKREASLATTLCVSQTCPGNRTSAVRFPNESYFCQLLGLPLPQLVPLAREGRVCACGRHVIDDMGSTKAAHETLLDALEALCFQAGIR